MMNSMRSFASSFVSKILMILLVITFGVWGVGDILRNSGANYAARVGDETISIRDFEVQKSLIQRQLEQLGTKMNASMLDAGILRKLVQEKLVLETMRDLGLYVNQDLLTKELKATPAFQNPDGSFNGKIFRLIARNNNIGESGILSQIGNDAQMKFMLSSLDMGDVTPPVPVRTLITTAALETRDSWIVSISPVTLDTPPSDDDAKAFYDKNKAVLYAEPETRTIDYIALRPSQLDELAEKSVTDDMMADAQKAQPKASKENIRKQLVSEQRDSVLHDFSGSVDDALAGGASLSDAVTKAGVSAQSHTLSDVNETTAKTSTDDVTRTVTEQGFQMGQGEASGVLVTPKGVPVIVYVKSIHPAAPQEFEKVAADVKAHVADQKRREATRTRIQEVKQALAALDQKQASDKQWQDVLKKFNLNPRRVVGLARPADDKSTVDGIPPALHQAIFERQIGAVAGPLTLDNGGQMLAIVTAIHHPTAEQVAGKASAQSDKSIKQLQHTLNETVQRNAFNAFAERHPVRINTQVLSKPAAAPADDDAQ